MNVIHTIASTGAKWGGTTTATIDLLSAINNLSLQHEDTVKLVSIALPDNCDDTDLALNFSWYERVPFDCKTPYRYSRNLREYLSEKRYDIYHANGMWLDDTHATCATARKLGRPYVITPHGMLYPEALKRSAWKKWPLRMLFFDKDIREASCIHATCEAEMRHIRALGYQGPIAVIGNPVVCPAIADTLLAQRSFLGCSRPKKLGFLGRLHPIKKAESLLYGVALRPEKDLEVIIMGSGSPEYESFLRSEVKRLGIENKVNFLGFISGDEKFRQLAGLDALFVPSDMENFGMIIPEALLVGTPVMASLGTPWESLNTERCGWWVDNSPESIAKVIDAISQSSSEQLRKMGLRGRDLVLSRFESSKVAVSMYSIYKWLNGEAPKPEFVYDA